MEGLSHSRILAFSQRGRLVDVFCSGWHVFYIVALCFLHYVWIPFLITAIEYTTWWLLWIRLLLYPVIMLLAPVTWWFTLMADLPFKEIFFGNGRASIRWERRKVPKKETKSLTARCDDDGGGERPDKSKDEESSESNLHRKIDFRAHLFAPPSTNFQSWEMLSSTAQRPADRATPLNFYDFSIITQKYTQHAAYM